MGISQTPSPADELAPYIQKFGDALTNYLQPNKDFQKQMQKQLAANPDLVLKFANLEAKAPGTLARMGFSKNQQETLGQASLETPEGELDRTTKPEQVAAGRAGISAKTATSQATAIESEAIVQVMQENPQLTYAAAKAKLEAGPVSVANAKTTGQRQEIELTIAERREALVKELPDLGTVDFYDEGRKFTLGQMDGQTTAAYFADPVTSKAFEGGIRAFQLERANEARRQFIKDGKKDTAQDRLDGRKSQNAYMQYSKYGSVGTVAAWEAYMYDPKAQERADELLAGAKPANFEEQQLLEVAEVSKKAGAARFNRDVLAVNNQISGFLSKLDKGIPEPERLQTIQSMNEQFQKRHDIGGGPIIKATWEDRTWPRGDRIKFTDEKGNVIDPNKVEELISSPATVADLSHGAQSAMTKISNVTDTGVREAAMAKYEAEDTSPGKSDSKGVRMQLESMGVLKARRGN